MIKKAYSIKDNASGLFSNPMFLVHENVAYRMLQTALEDPNTNIHRYPADHSLYYVGDYDDVLGKFFSLTEPEHMINAEVFRMQLTGDSENEISN